jgi:hypothetical protein
LRIRSIDGDRAHKYAAQGGEQDGRYEDHDKAVFHSSIPRYTLHLTGKPALASANADSAECYFEHPHGLPALNGLHAIVLAPKELAAL